MMSEEMINEIQQLWGYVEAEGTELAKLRRDLTDLRKEVEALASKR